MIEYRQLDKTARLLAIRRRIEDLERQHHNLYLSVESPDLSRPVSEMDTKNLEMLEESINKLKAMEQEIEDSSR